MSDNRAFVVEVSPISTSLASGAHLPTIHYFSKTPFPQGALISVPFRKKDMYAIVLSSLTAREARANIKASNIRFRSIESDKVITFAPAIVESIARTAEVFAQPVGVAFSALFSPLLLDRFPQEKKQKKPARSRKEPTRYQEKPPKRNTAEGDFEFRVDEYEKDIRTHSKKKQSSLFLVPTIVDGRRLSEAFESRGIEHVFLSSSISKKRRGEILEQLFKKPAVCIATTGFAAMPLKNLGAIILERAGSSLYIRDRFPRIDARAFAYMRAQVENIPLTLGDVLAPLEYMPRPRASKKEPARSRKTGLSFEHISLVDMKPDEDAPFRIISEELIEKTKEVIEGGGKAMWFVARRGLFPTTVCRDCGELYTCPECGAPLVLHENKNGSEKTRTFLCHRCGHTEGALTACKNCKSWRLEPLGIALEAVAKIAAKHFKNIFTISSETQAKSNKARAAVKKEIEKAELVIGTDALLQHIDRRDLLGVVSIDSRLSIPHYSAEESALRTLLELASRAQSALVQTRKHKHRVFAALESGSIGAFLEEEQKIRKALLFPPYATLIELHITDSLDRARARRDEVKENIARLAPDCPLYTTPLQKKAGARRADVRVVIKCKTPLAENPGLHEYISSFLPGIRLYIHPALP